MYRKDRCFLLFNAVMMNAFCMVYPASSTTVSIVSGFERQLLQQGESVTLTCTATGAFHVSIRWLLDGLPLEYDQDPKQTNSVFQSAYNPYKSNAGDYLHSKYSIETSNEVSEEDSDTNAGDAIETEEVSSAGNKSKSFTDRDDTTSAPEAIHIQSSVNSFNDGQSLNVLDISISEKTPRLVTMKSSLSLNNATVQDGGIYACVAQSVFLHTASWRKKITVAGPLSLRRNRPVPALLNSLVIIPCTVLGSNDDFEVRWSYREFPGRGRSNLESSEIWVSMPNDARQKIHQNGSLEIPEAKKSNEGIYKCQVELNGILQETETPMRVMVPPKIKTFAFEAVRVGQPFAEFCVITEGDLPLNIYWKKDGVTIRPNDRIEMTRSAVSTSLSLSIRSVTLELAGDYTCCASNNVSSTCHTSSLVVLDPPKILNLPSELSKISGDRVEINCEATGYPKPNITWARVSDDSKSDYISIPFRNEDDTTKEIFGFPKIYQTKNGSLVIANVSSPDAGKYFCRAKNNVDESSNFLSLQVHNPARILDVFGTRDITHRRDLRLKCTTWGDDVIDVTWLKDGRTLTAGQARVQTSAKDHGKLDSQYAVTLNRLMIGNATRSDTGLYTCVAKNKYGISKREMSVLVRAPPMAPSEFKVIDKGTSFLRLLVTPGKDDGGSRVWKYQLSYLQLAHANDTPSSPEGIPTPTKSLDEANSPVRVTQPASAKPGAQEIVLDKLECGTQYEVVIRARNEIGASPLATGLTATTLGTAPVLPAEKELLLFKNQTTVVLDLRAFQNGGCPITELWIEIAQHGTTEWNVTKLDREVLDGRLSGDTKTGDVGDQNPGYFLFTDLHVGTWYKVWISVCNVAGCNYKTYSLATLLANGATIPPIERKTAESHDRRFLIPMICGFGLVILLASLLLLYRHKQRAKKVTRMKAAKKMARTLLYKTDDDGPPDSGIRVSLPNAEGTSPASVLVETSVSIDSDGETSVQAAERGERRGSCEPLVNDSATERCDVLTHLPTVSGATTLSQGKASACSWGSERTKVSREGKLSLKDNAELAVFRDMASSDDEDPSTEPLVCDESAFGDSGTWSFFKPARGAAIAQTDRALPKKATKPAVSRQSSTSSGTDEELAQVFGLTCSKHKPETEKTRKSDVNKNYRPSSNEDNRSTREWKPPGSRNRQEKQFPRPGLIADLVKQELRSNSTGMMQKNGPRHFRPLNNDGTHGAKRQHQVNTRPNPAFNTSNHTQFNMHRPYSGHQRGNTYANDHTHDLRSQLTAHAQNADILRASPYEERQWVDTYDSRCSTNRSKPPSWGSIELDKQGFLTPPPSADPTPLRPHRDRGAPKYRGSDTNTDTDVVFDYPAKDNNRKLDTSSPRDSGIGSDEGPATRHMTASVSPATMKVRAGRKSQDSLDEMEMKKGDGLISGHAHSNARKEHQFMMSPPLTPPVNQAKLQPHIFVDISSKSNTTPPRTARSSYPPCGQNVPMGGKQPRRLDCIPTPPPSGHNTPVDGTGSRPKSKQDRWLVADLDGRHDSRHKNRPHKKDSNYSLGKKDRGWQTSTLV